MWDAFIDQMKRYDPKGVFENQYTHKLFTTGAALKVVTS